MFDKKDDALHVNFELPQTKITDNAMVEFFEPLREHVREKADDTDDSLRTAVQSLAFLSEMSEKVEKLTEEKRMLEALVLATTKWVLMRAKKPVVVISCDRLPRDRGPVHVALLASFVGGPITVIPLALILNEMVMRRMDKNGILTKSPPDGWAFGKAVFQHHVWRTLYDPPRPVDLDECYKINEGLTTDDLLAVLADGTHDEHTARNSNLFE